MELKKMSGGMMADTDELTAVPESVLENETFMGHGEDETQSGTMPDMSKVKNSPTIQNEGKTVPAHRATNAKSTTNSDGTAQIVMSPPKGFFPGEGKAFVGCTPEELGITPENIPTGRTVCLVNGTWGADADFSSDDLKEGKVAYGPAGRVIGNGKNYGQVSKTLAAGETYDVKKGFYDDGKVTAKDLASQTAGNLDAARMVSGQSGYSNGKKVNGSMVDRGVCQWAGRGGHGGGGMSEGTENGTEYYAFNNAPDGWYHNKGESWSPELRLERYKVRDYLGVSASKILSGQCIAGIWGTAPVINDLNLRWVDNMEYYYPNTNDWDFNNLDTDHGNWFLCNIPASQGYVIIRVSCGNTDAATSMPQNAWCCIGTNTWRMLTLRPYASTDSSTNTQTVRMMFWRSANGDLYYHPMRGSTYGTFATSIVVLASTTVNLSKWS